MVAVPDEYLTTVAFVCVEKVVEGSTVHEPCATAFWVRVDIEGFNGAQVDYLVTARHALDEARAEGHEQVWVRNNKKGGTFEIPVRVERFTVSPNADVAAVLIPRDALPPDVKFTDVGAGSLALDTFVGPGPDYFWSGETKTIGHIEFQPRVGTEVYFVGLFVQSWGMDSNLPVARFGHISRMPSSVRAKAAQTTTPLVAYLAETHSWGGQSGSPAFFLHPVEHTTRYQDEEGNITREESGRMYITGFLGVLSGHFDIPQKAKTKGERSGDDITTALNSGIGIVTPAQAVKELLMSESLKEERAEWRRRLEQNVPAATLDVATGTPEGGEVFTASDFDEALKKVARKRPSQSDQEASGT